MKWPKLIQKMYKAIIERDEDKEKELYFKAMKKNFKDKKEEKKITAKKTIIK